MRPLHAVTACLLVLSAVSAAPTVALGQTDKAALDRAAAMQRARADAGEVAAVLQRTFRQTGTQATAILARVGYAEEATATAVRSTYRAGFAELTEWMVATDYRPEGVVAALAGQRAPVDEMVKGMRSARVATREVAGALKATYRNAREWLPGLTRALTAEGVLAGTPEALAAAARDMGLTAEEAVDWMMDQGVDAVTALVAVLSAGFDPDGVGAKAAKLGVDAAELAARSAAAGVAVEVVTKVVAVVVAGVGHGLDRAAAAAVAAALVAAGYAPDEVLDAMRAVLDTTQAVVEAALAAGMSTTEAVLWATSRGHATAQQVVAWLLEASVPAVEAAEALVGAGIDGATAVAALVGNQASVAAPVLREAIRRVVELTGANIEAVVVWLTDTTGLDPADVVAILDASFDRSAEQIALVLRNAGWTATDIAEGLNRGLDASAAVVAQALRHIGTSFEDIATALRDGMNAGAEEIAAALLAASASIQEILAILMSLFQLTADAAWAIINALG
ncbi:MAG: hypothetical protein RJQ04_01185 [Longimicrobiales bacterium]